MILDPQLLAEISEYVIVELLSIFNEDDPGDSKTTNDVLPNKVLGIFLYDSGQWFCLNAASCIQLISACELVRVSPNGSRVFLRVLPS